MGTQRQKQRQGRAAIGRVPARWQGHQSGGGNRYLAGGTSFGRLLETMAFHACGLLRRKAQFEKLELRYTTAGSLLNVPREIDTRIPLTGKRAR